MTADAHTGGHPFPRLSSRADLARWDLSERDVETFHERGFLTRLPLLTHDQVIELRERLERIGEHIDELRPRLYEIEAAWAERPDEVVLHFLGGWLVDGWLRALVFHPGVTVPLARLLGTDRLRFWHDQVFWKPAHHRGVVPWHQDYSYWTRTSPAAHITMFVALDAMGPENGGLHYVPGSHRWPTLPAVAFGGDMDQLAAHLDEAQRAAFAPVPVELAAGEAAIHHSHTVHGSFGNTSDGPRRALVLNYMGPETRTTAAGPLLAGTPAFAADARVQGRHFPLALDLTALML